MIFREFISEDKPIMVLIHGLLTPWQIWTPQIDSFREKYNIYVVSLNAHTEETPSQFVSVAAEADEIVQYFIEKGVKTVDVICGISLGGKIAFEIWKKGKLAINNLILDGAPLVSCPKFAINIMIKNYKSILRKSRNRDDKVIKNFKKYFLPEKYLNSYLKIADQFTDRSIENIATTVFSGGLVPDIDNKSRILFIHGTKVNEFVSKKSATKMKKYYPQTEIHCFKGDSHCYKVIYTPEIWIDIVVKFLESK